MFTILNLISVVLCLCCLLRISLLYCVVNFDYHLRHVMGQFQLYSVSTFVNNILVVCCVVYLRCLDKEVHPQLGNHLTILVFHL